MLAIVAGRLMVICNIVVSEVLDIFGSVVVIFEVVTIATACIYDLLAFFDCLLVVLKVCMLGIWELV